MNTNKYPRLFTPENVANAPDSTAFVRVGHDIYGDIQLDLVTSNGDTLSTLMHIVRNGLDLAPHANPAGYSAGTQFVGCSGMLRRA